MTMLHTTNASAKVYMGKITLEVGEVDIVSAVPTSGYTASGSFSKDGTCFVITANGSYYCKIKANKVGKGTLSYWGSVAPSGSWSTYIYDYYWDVEVKAAAVPVTGITLNTSSATLKVGETMQLSATVSPSNATDKSVSWSSNSSSVATVSSSGLVTAKGEGTATITCRANDGSGISRTCSITVSPAATVLVTSISNFTPYASLLVGETKQITYDIWPRNATDQSVSWSSSNSSVASVSSSGLVTANGKGLATITCITNDGSGIQATCKVTVSEPITININSTNFPDDNFRNFVLEQDYGKDGVLTGDEIKNITSIRVESKNISSLKGIEYFTALKELECNSNPLTYLDVSNNYALEKLECLNHQLTTMDLSKNTALKELRCSGGKNQTSLDVSKNTALEYLWCGHDNLTSLDVSKNTALKELICYYNQLTTLDVSKNLTLKRLDCSNNQLSSLDVSKNTELEELDCYHNQLASLDVSNNTGLKTLEFGSNNIKGTAMDAVINSLPYNTSSEEHYFRGIFLPEYDTNVCTMTQLAAVRAKGWIPQYYNSGWFEYGTSSDESSLKINSANFPDENFRNYLLEQSYGIDGVLSDDEISKITSIDVHERNISSLKGIEYFTSLILLSCYNNQLTALDVSKNTALTYLLCGSNKLTTLNVSKNTALTSLSCESNNLTALDVSKNTLLTFLWCDNNQLTSLDMSRNTALVKLSCGNNQLTSLDVTWNTAITSLWCWNNKLTSLDVSKNTALTSLGCKRNQLHSLDVSKNSVLTELDCGENNIKGKAMDALIESLTNNNSNEEHYFRAIYRLAYETNVCTKKQVAAVKAKGWIPQYYNGEGWVEYEGSDDTSIPTSISLPVSQTVEVGKTIQLTPTIEPATAEATLTWTTDDATIAKVTSTGIVFGIKEGTAIITVTTDNGLKAECFVTVQLASGISTVGVDSEAEPIYTLSGQRLNALRKGLNIVGGKKILVK